MIPVSDLREIYLLKNLTDEELERLGAVMKLQQFEKNSYIVHAAEPGPSMMFIGEGEVKITLISPDGKEIVVALMRKGEFFGEIALLTGEDRSANVVATKDCRLYVLHQDAFKQHVQQNHGLAFSMLQELAFRLRTATGKIGDLALYDVFCRVARTLKGLSERRVSEAGKEEWILPRRPTHQELAAMVGTSREMVTRALKDLEEDGYILTEGKQVVISGIPG